ncbi:MAG TPA: DUF2256 domain-containing protein, partial [Cellvibrionaceae bacterium]|nr:DUF2256 domain-containing protein [Cellvibrionaceae bacterium]HNG59811.1 DUF2256 domain-containing protein [Cellvibrionaceae bacterium]
MAHLKPHLPTKICPVCKRQFVWRKKWRRAWPGVIYCSERCRGAKEPLKNYLTRPSVVEFGK